VKWEKLRFKIVSVLVRETNCSVVTVSHGALLRHVQVRWKPAPERVRAPCKACVVVFDRCARFEESDCLGVQSKIGGKFHLKLNTDERPIANKYREGKMQRTLKRELKVLEIVKREAIRISHCLAFNQFGACGNDQHRSTSRGSWSFSGWLGVPL